MSRYIDADALLKGWGIELPKKRPIQGKQSKEFLAFMKKYENHPFYLAIIDIYLEESADVHEVVHGEWIYDKTSTLWECSNCHEEEIRSTTYCPHCGARNRGGR